VNNRKRKARKVRRHRIARRARAREADRVLRWYSLVLHPLMDRARARSWVRIKAGLRDYVETHTPVRDSRGVLRAQLVRDPRRDVVAFAQQMGWHVPEYVARLLHTIDGPGAGTVRIRFRIRNPRLSLYSMRDEYTKVRF
jgi:hypothetical protein